MLLQFVGADLMTVLFVQQISFIYLKQRTSADWSVSFVLSRTCLKDSQTELITPLEVMRFCRRRSVGSIPVRNQYHFGLIYKCCNETAIDGLEQLDGMVGIVDIPSDTHTNIHYTHHPIQLL